MMTHSVIPMVDLQSRPMRETQPETESEIEARVRRAREDLVPRIHVEMRRLKWRIRELERQMSSDDSDRSRAAIRKEINEAASEVRVLQHVLTGQEPPEPGRMKMPKNILRQGGGFIARIQGEWGGRRIIASSERFMTIAEAQEALPEVRARMDRKLEQLEREESERGERDT